MPDSNGLREEVYFRWGTRSGSYPNETPEQAMTSTGTFSAEITGLTASTTYYFVAIAGESGQGSEKSFYTGDPPEAIVETLEPGGITSSSAILNGNLVDMSGRASVEVYFKWGTSPGSYPNETARQTLTVTGLFSAGISGLSAGNTYYFVAGTSESGQGSENSFYVSDLPDGTVEALNATNASSLFVTLNGNLVDLEGNPSVEVYFAWGTSSGIYTNETPHQTMTVTGLFSIQVMGTFTPGNTYYYIARVGTLGRGEEQSFYVW